MPRKPSEKMVEAEKLFNKGMAMVEIAKKLGVSDGTVRSWKNRYGWGNSSKKKKRNVAKDKKDKNATLQKSKGGAPKGNKNAKGNRGNPNPVPPIKHGGYSQVYWDSLDEEEKEIINEMSDDMEMQLLDQIRLYAVRERRLMKAINQYRNQEGGIYNSAASRTETKRKFKDQAEKELYEERVAEKVANGDRLPGETYELFTQTSATIDLIARLERELTSVQSKKTKAIEALNKYRLESKKLEGGSSDNDVVRTWGEKLLQQRRDAQSDE